MVKFSLNFFDAVLLVVAAALLVLQKLTVGSVFDDVIHDVISRCPSVDLPWLDTALALANIQQTIETSAMQPHFRHEQAADNRQNDTSMDDNIDDLASKQVTDYSHLYIYKKSSPVTAAQRQATAEYIALSSSSSSDEGESDSQLYSVAVPDVARIPDSSVTAADITPTTSVHSSKRPKLYRSVNTGLQIANPNKKRKKK